MPPVEQILSGLELIANAWQPLAIFWHIYFIVAAIGLLSGARPSKRMCAVACSLPLLSVSVVAWASANPFNGIIFAIIGLVLFTIAFKLPREAITIAPVWELIPGILMIVFGLIYPHFLATNSLLTYCYAAPTGLIPCPTLSVVIGFVLVTRRFDSRTFPLVLGCTGLFYGGTGVGQLHVTLDWVLIGGALLLVIISLLPKGRKIPAVN